MDIYVKGRRFATKHLKHTITGSTSIDTAVGIQSTIQYMWGKGRIPV